MSQDPVAPAEHAAWLEATLAADHRHLLVAEVDGRPAGMLRFDRLDVGSWEISINLAPERRGQGLGRELLDAGAGWLLGAVGPAAVVANVRVDNDASLRSFEAAGYVEVARERGWVRLRLRVGSEDAR